MAVLDLLQSLLGFLPKVIVGLREIITKIILALHLPTSSAMTLGTLSISFVLGYIFLKQWIVSGAFMRMRTIISYIILVLLIYITLNYVGVS